jgi:sugar transferase EpsL
MRTARAVIKRTLDVSLSVLALLLLSPVLIVVAVLVARRLGRPVLFSQPRPGLHGRIFTLYKFRTMSDARDEGGELLPNERRMTRFGSMLRSTSIDELPELLNVLRGDMSLVGPRPLMVAYLERYNAFQARRHEVRPGITGWAQVHGRNALAWTEKFALDVWYVDNHSLWLDVLTLWKTVAAVVSRQGISHEGDVAMPQFLGNPPEESAEPECAAPPAAGGTVGTGGSVSSRA